MSAPAQAKPDSEAQLAEIVKAASASRTCLSAIGGGTKQALGHPIERCQMVDMGALDEVALYEPAALTIVTGAGMKLADLKRTLEAEGQFLPFEPPSYAKLLGSEGQATIGGTVACGLSGPRRITAGAARDSLIGVRFVSGEGEQIKNGGRVMKNVTGYDLVKLMCGSYGTLGILTQLSFKLLPKPEAAATLQIYGLDEATACRAMASALGSPFGISGAAHLPSGIATDNAVTFLRLEGFAKSVAYRIEKLREILARFEPASMDIQEDADGLWDAIAEADYFANAPGAVWRLSVRPGASAAAMEQLREECEVRLFYDWGGGLVWLATDEKNEANSAPIRKAARQAGGYATLIRASEGMRRQVPVFQPQSEAIESISEQLRQQFDPAGILNPGRMRQGALAQGRHGHMNFMERT